MLRREVAKALARRKTPIAVKRYICANCGAKIQLNKDDPVVIGQCKYCGCPQTSFRKVYIWNQEGLGK